MNFGTDYTDYQRTLVYDKEHGNAAQQADASARPTPAR